jgi:predicted secreted hydrolase
MGRILILGVVVLAVAVFGFSLIDVSGGGDVAASAVLLGTAGDTTGFERAVAPLDWQFPRDFGAHEAYQTEWWYYTGNVQTEDGRRFGYQFTIFRRAIAPPTARADSESEWRADQLYMAHFGLSDVAGERFFHEERFSRGGADLAGATADPRYHVWLEDWQVTALDSSAQTTRISAQMAEGAALDLTLTQTKPPALHGDGGLSAKSSDAGNASHYYSLTRLATEGTITIGGETFTVSGATWKDHEFSTCALGSDGVGWDWFGLQLDDNRELMVGQIRLADGRRDPSFGGLLVNPDGTTRYLPSDSFTIEALDSWESPHTGAVYPSGWTITVETGDGAPLRLTVTPQLLDQELHGGGIAYWEGTVRLEGDITGYGYAELTGYADSLTGRF